MKRFGRYVAVGFLSFLLLAGLGLAHTWFFKPVTVDLFYTRVFAAFALKSPETLSGMGILPGFLDFHSDDFDDVSPQAQQRMAAQVADDLATLKRYERAGMTGEAGLSYDTLVHFLEMEAEGARFPNHQFPVKQSQGIQSSLPAFMADVHLVESKGDAENYIARLDKFPLKFEQTLQQIRLSESKGIVPPRFAIDKVLAEMNGFVATPPAGNSLYVSFAGKLKKVPAAELSAEEQAALLARAARSIEASVYPAYRSMIAHFTALQKKTAASHGAWSLPDGDAWYAHLVRRHTTTTMTPQQVHDVGLAEVARIAAQMDEILKGQGLAEGTVGARVQALASRSEHQFANTPEGKQAMLARYQEILAEIDQGMAKVFDLRPRGKVEVRPVPELSQAGAPAAYYNPGSLDGARPGIFYANMRDPGATPKFSMKSLAYHEGIPGHHFQTMIARELTDVPVFRTVIPFTAYEEGWALYAERLAGELGYGSEPLYTLGRLSFEMLRASRLVVDTGIHSQRWTRERAIAYMVDHTGMGEKEVASEVERYFVNPGQALGYEVGMLKILALREKARSSLGERFDLKQFHNEALRHGALPLTVLEGVIDDWIARRKGEGAALAAAN